MIETFKYPEGKLTIRIVLKMLKRDNQNTFQLNNSKLSPSFANTVCICAIFGPLRFLHKLSSKLVVGLLFPLSSGLLPSINAKDSILTFWVKKNRSQFSRCCNLILSKCIVISQWRAVKRLKA